MRTETSLAGSRGGAFAVADRADEAFLTLTVAGQLCGVPVLTVRDVLGSQAITRIPLAPPEVAGGLNLRGRIVTAIDLRRRLGLPGRAPGERAMSVVVEQSGELYSLLADQVGDVIPLPRDGFAANPPTLDPMWRDVSRGVQRQDEKLLILLDVERVLAIGWAEDGREPQHAELPGGGRQPRRAQGGAARAGRLRLRGARGRGRRAGAGGLPQRGAGLRAARLEHAGDGRHHLPARRARRAWRPQAAGHALHDREHAGAHPGGAGAGAQEYVMKPFDAEILGGKLLQLGVLKDAA
jgi:purine-binding chemotaxis protein CheW